MQVTPATTYETISAGPATLWAAAPVATKMPAPMIAPTPRAESWTGPSTRRSRFSPFISSSSISRGFLAKRRFAMDSRPPKARSTVKPRSCLAAARRPRWTSARLPSSPRLPRRSGDVGIQLAPEEIDGDARQHDAQAGTCGPRLVDEQHERDHRRGHDVEGRHHRVAEGAVGPLRVRPLAPQHEQAGDGQDVEDEHREDDVVEQLAIEVAVGHLAGGVGHPRARQHQERGPDTLQHEPEGRHVTGVETARA